MNLMSIAKLGVCLMMDFVGLVIAGVEVPSFLMGLPSWIVFNFSKTGWAVVSTILLFGMFRSGWAFLQLSDAMPGASMVPMATLLWLEDEGVIEL